MIRRINNRQVLSNNPDSVRIRMPIKSMLYNQTAKKAPKDIPAIIGRKL